MGISLRDLADDGDVSMRSIASENELTAEPFTFRELITPQVVGDQEYSYEPWSNWVGDHAEWRYAAEPSSRAEIVSTVATMVHTDREIRGVGSGHSHSNAPEPPDYFVDFGSLTGPLPDNGWLKEDVDTTHHRRLRAGTILKELNRDLLHANDLALENMGSFDGQTIAGAVNTSTHGTGLELPSVSDAVRSVEIATAPESYSGDPIVRLYRIEPTDGITDRAAFEADTGEHEMELLQDDDLFHSVVVGYGCMGVVYAYTMEVRDSYWLKEDSKLLDWRTLRGALEEGVEEFVTLGDTRHFQFLLNLAAEQVPANRLKTDGHEEENNPVCLVRRHFETPEKPKPGDWGDEEFQVYDDRWPPERRKESVQDIGKTVFNDLHPLKPNKGRAKQLHTKFFHPSADRKPFVKKRTETAWYVALRRLRDRGNMPPEPPTPATSTDIAVPLEHLNDAIDEIRDIVTKVKQTHSVKPGLKKREEREYDVFFGVPMGVRFTDASDHFLSPEFDRPSANIEVPFAVNEGTTKATLRGGVPDLTQEQLREEVAEPALEEIERVLVEKYEGRPHMGKHNTVTGAELNEMYRYFDASDSDDVDVGWFQAYERFNAFGTFDNAFTEQLGLAGYTPDDPSPQTGSESPGTEPTETEAQSGTGETGVTRTRTESTDAGGEPETAESEPSGTEGAGPGLGFLAGLAGVGTGAWLLGRKSNADDDTDAGKTGAEE